MFFGAERSANGVIFMVFLLCCFLALFNENFSASVAFECKNYTLHLRPEGFLCSARLGLNKKICQFAFLRVLFSFLAAMTLHKLSEIAAALVFVVSLRLCLLAMK